jgi:hypothetical protein
VGPEADGRGSHGSENQMQFSAMQVRNRLAPDLACSVVDEAIGAFDYELLGLYSNDSNYPIINRD